MVLEAVLVQVLNHFLRPYVKNLDASQLKVAIFSGDVLLENLELKENALDDLNLPVRVFRGYLERLKLKIPWKSLYSSPIVAEIDGLYAIVGPATAFKYDAEKSAKESKERKEKQLKRIEEARKRAAEPKNEKAGQDSGFVERLITAAIRNIQITVKNIHIRYEDSVTNVAHPFSFGITLDSLFVQSTDCEYVVGGMSVDPDPSSMLIYKLLQLNCLAVYWQSNDSLLGTSPPDNWTEILKKDVARPNRAPPDAIHYVVHPITLEARLQVTRKPGRKMDVPQALVKVTLHQVALSLSKHQFQDIMSLVESLDRMSINLKYLKYRPGGGVGVREDPRQWWRYAISAVTEEEVRRKLEMWSWKHIQTHRKLCRQYTESYARKLMAKTITSGLQKELDFLETKLDIFNLTICRQLAESKAAVVKRQAEAEAKKEESGGGGGWWGWATGRGTSSTEEEKEEIVTVPMPTEEELQDERKRMYEAIGYSESAQVPVYPKEYVAHSISVRLEKVSVQLRNENGTLAHVVTSLVSATVQNRPSSKNITVQTTVGRLTARGLENGTSGERGEGPIIVSSKHDENASLLDLSVDINPVNSTVSQRLKVKLLPIQITYHADTVDGVISMFKPSKDVHLQRLSAAAASTLEELKTQGRAGLEHAISQRKLLDLDVVLSSPCLVVPENGALSDSSCVLVADLGQLEIKSDLRSYVPDVRGATDAELDEAFYDHFNLSLKRLQVLLAAPGQDWRSAWSSSGTSPLHVLEPTSLELGLKKSLLPNDTRLPNLKVEGELPALTLSVSDKKLKQLLQVVQSLPLPPPSLAKQNMEASSTYSIPDQPSHMGTNSIVEHISDTLLVGSVQPEAESSEEEGFETASECESDEEGVLHHQQHKSQPAALSTTKLTLHFVLHQVGILFSEHHETSGCDTPRLHLMVTSVTSDLVMRSWDMGLAVSIGDLCIADHYITGPKGEPGTFLATQLTEGQKLLTFSYSKFDPGAPHFASEFGLTRQSISASLALLRLSLHSDSLLNLIDISRSVTSVLQSRDKTEGNETEERVHNSTKSLSSSNRSSESGEEEQQQTLEGRSDERELQVKVCLQGLEVGLCGGDLGEVMSTSVTGIEAHVNKFQDYLQVEASVADIVLLNNEPKVHHHKMIEKLDQEKEVLSLKITVFDTPASVRNPHDLSLCDLDITAEVKRLRVMIIFSFLARVQRFARQFLHRLKLDQSTIDSAREAASNTASKTAEALKERSSSRVKLSVTIGAPLLVVPYTPPPSFSPLPPSLSPPPSLSSPPPSSQPPSPSQRRAFVANLGDLTIGNVFRLASDVVAVGKAPGEEAGKRDAAQFLSRSGLPAVVDCMTITISSLQLSRVMDVEKASSELQSHDIEADSHMLLKPLEFRGQITRRLSGWCTAIPAVSISCILKRTQMQFSPQDYQDVMCVLQDIKAMNQKESTAELAATGEAEDKPETEKKEILVDEKAVLRVEEGEGEGSSVASDVTVHLEADVESLELLLCSDVGGVAEIKIRGAAASVDMLNDRLAIKARISGVEVFDCTPGVLYKKIVSVEEHRLAVEAWVEYFFNATSGEGAYDTSKWDLSVGLRVNRTRVVALYLFVTRVLSYIRQLTAQKQDPNNVFEPQTTRDLEETQAVQKTEESKSGVPMRIKLDVSVQAPEITVPLNSKSCDIVVLDLGQLCLTNGFFGVDVGFSKDRNIALYEQHDLKLTKLQLYRSVWDGERNKPSACQRGLLQPICLTVELHRNLSADWYHGMPTLSLDAKLGPLLVVASGDDIESVCLILSGNLKETCSPTDVDTGNVGWSISASIADETNHEHNTGTSETVAGDSTDSSEQPFTELLVSARIQSIGLKLYSKDQQHPLTCEDESTWTRERRREFAEVLLEDLQAGVKKESSGATSVTLSLDNCMLDDLRTRMDEDRDPGKEEEEEEEEEEDDEGSTRESSVDMVPVLKKDTPEMRIRRMIEKRAFDGEPLISLEYNLTPDNSTNIVSSVNGIQVLVNLRFIEALTLFLLESIKPLKPEKPEEEEEDEEEDKEEKEGTVPRTGVSTSQSVEEKGKESKMSISVKVLHPLIALLEDAGQTSSLALVCQMEVGVNLTHKLPSNCASLSGSLSGLSLAVARYPALERTILKPVLGPLSEEILVYMDQWNGTTKISATVPSLEMVLSPATVRIVLNSIRSLSSRHTVELEVGETAPANLWSSRSITRGRLRKKWYLKETDPSHHITPSISHLTSHFSTISSTTSHLWSESFELEVANISVLVEQEVTTPFLRTFPAISMAMGKYSRKALTLQLRDWSSKLKVNTELRLEVSYYNIRNDSWEPILEPIVDPDNKDKYTSWCMKVSVVRQPPTHSKHHVEEAVRAEEEEEEEEVVNLTVDVVADSALQLTLTKSSLGIFSELVQAYTEKKGVAIEEVDTPETYDAAFTVVNKLGRNCPVTVKPANTLKVHGAYSPVLREGDPALPLHPTEGVVKMKPGELLPRDSHLGRVHILQLLIEGVAALDVALGMYERTYYHIVPVSSSSSSSPGSSTGGSGDRGKGGGAGVVVNIDRTAGTPVVTLRSPLQVHNHLDQLVTVHHSLSHAPPPPSTAPQSGVGGVARVPPGSLVPLPLSASCGGYLFFQLPHTGLSQPPVQWSNGESLDIGCSITRSEALAGARTSHKFSFIHTAVEEEEYSRSPSVPLSDRAHHVVHLHQPLVVHNLLPYSLSLGEEGYSMALIASGSQTHISYTKLSQTKKFLVEVEKRDKRWSGSFMMGYRSEEETAFTVSHEACNLELLVKKEEKGAWQLSVCSRNWMVNKTGLALQYRPPDGFFSFGQKPSEVYTHDSKSAISLYPHKEVCVRVVKGERCSEWSNKFSLETLGSEGIFTCSFSKPAEDLQIGTKVELAKFGTTRILTLSPFYIINNTTRDSVSFRECIRNSSNISMILPGKLVPFWPSPGSKSLEISVGDETMRLHSSPFLFTETSSLLVRTHHPQVPAVVVEVQVTGSANIITFTPYYSGCVPLQLVNHTEHLLTFKQIDGPCVYQLESKQSLMYTWDLPLGVKALALLANKLNPQVDGKGYFFLSQDNVRSSGSIEEDSVGEMGKEEEEEEEREVEEAAGGQEVTQFQRTEGDTDEVDFSLPEKLRRLSDEVKKSVRIKSNKKRGKRKRVYWISFMDGLQRVLLLTTSRGHVKRVSTHGGTAKEPPHTELSLSLIGTGLSLVDDLRGQEITYIGIPQSQKEWQIRVKKLWKSLPHDVSDKLEKLYDPSTQKARGKQPLPDSAYEVDFGRMYLYKNGSKNRLRRSHFEGVYARVTLSEHLTSLSLRISHVQVDNQLPLALQPIIIYPYPPPPSIATSCAPKPFIEGTLVIHKTEQSNVSQIQFLQVLVQEVGVNLDMSFLMALLGLFSNLPSNSTEAQIVCREVEYAKLPLRESKVAAVSAAVSRKYFKLLHLSPLIIHLSFSLEMSDQEGKEAKKATQTNIFMSMILNVLLSFATIVGKTKDAELHLRYFELENEALTQQALMDRVQKHYIQEGVIQMYSVVLGLEVLGNPVGFVRGLKTGAVGLFYHPLQGAVLGPEEFMEGVVLGSRQFVGGTVGGISGVLGKVTGVLGDTAANLTMDEEFQSQRKRERTRGNVGQSLEGAARGVLAGVTGVISQPIKGAKKEGWLGLVKGAGKGVLGLVLRPTGGLIDLTSATFNAVQRKTKVGNYDITQLRPPRFIGQPKFVSPYSPHKAEGYALFLALENGRLRAEGDVYFDFVELEESPLRNLLITNNRFLVIKRNPIFDRFEEEEVVMFRDMCGKTRAERDKVIVPVREEQGWFRSSKKKVHTREVEVPNSKIATAAVTLVNQAYQEYSTTQTKK